MKVYDFIIVGQGLAGTLLSYQLIKRGKTVLVIDNANPNAASKVASGIINPITGRKFVTSWRIDEFFPVAKKLYLELEEVLKIEIYRKVNIIRSLVSAKDENDWWAKLQLPKNKAYALSEFDLDNYKRKTTESFSYGELQNCARILTSELVGAYRNWLIESDSYLEASFDHADLKIDQNHVVYQNHQADKIIFCEGWRVIYNPLFKYLPFDPAKGEILIVRIPDLKVSKLLKNRLFFVPLEDNLFWIGGTYGWKDYEETPTNEKRKYLEDNLKEVLLVPYEIIDHKAAIRPATKHRRPYLGIHPDYSNVYLFNGLGTKGASLGPFWSRHLADHLLNGIEIDIEVNISKFSISE